MKKNKNRHFNVWYYFKKTCIETTGLKLLTIPIGLGVATLLSTIAENAASGNVPTVISTSSVLVVIIVLSTVICTSLDIQIQKRKSLAENKCRVGFLNVLLKNPLDKIYKIEKGEINENLNDDISMLEKRYTELFPVVISSTISILFYVAFLSMQSVLVAITLIAMSLLQLIPPIIVRRFMQISYDECRDIEAELTDHVTEAVDGFDVIKLYGIENWWLKKLSLLQKRYLRVGRKADAIAATQRALFRAIENILKFGTYAIMGVYVMLGYCELSVVVKAIYLSAGLFDDVKNIFSTLPQFAVSRNANSRLEKWEPDTSSNDRPISVGDTFTLHEVYYNVSGHQVLDGINYRFLSNSSYFLEGANGAGKTTLLNLIMGLIKPTNGVVSLRRIPSIL